MQFINGNIDRDIKWLKTRKVATVLSFVFLYEMQLMKLHPLNLADT